MSVLDEIRQKMEGFANKANYYLLRAAYILSLAKIIRGSPLHIPLDSGHRFRAKPATHSD